MGNKKHTHCSTEVKETMGLEFEMYKAMLILMAWHSGKMYKVMLILMAWHH